MAVDTKRERFTEKDVEVIDGLLKCIVEINDDVEWYYDEDGCLVVEGLHVDSITFTGWRTAKAGLEMYLAGFETARCTTSVEDRHE